jgi:hypothetical protein
MRLSRALLLSIIALSWLASQPSMASDRESWEALQDARLLESMDGDPEGALAVYESLLVDLEPGSELWQHCTFSMGRVHMSAGRMTEARMLFSELLGEPLFAQQAREMIVVIRMLERPIEELPYVDRMAFGESRWIRGPMHGTPDDLHFVDEPEFCLAWDLTVVANATDFIVLPLDTPGVRPKTLEFVARSRNFTSRVIVVMEHDGGKWRTEILELPTGEWSEISVDLKEMVRLRGQQRIPDPGRVKALILQDMTGQVSAEQGANRIEIKSTLIY